MNVLRPTMTSPLFATQPHYEKIPDCRAGACAAPLVTRGIPQAAALQISVGAAFLSSEALAKDECLDSKVAPHTNILNRGIKPLLQFGTEHRLHRPLIPSIRRWALGLSFSLITASATFAADALPKVRLFTTGGTIQSKGAHREKLMEYSDGKVSPQELIADLPEMKEVADLSYEEIANVGSPSMTTELTIKLAKAVSAWLAQPESAGAVITHGTATLEETAYFLNLVIKSNKPVVVVGAMRPFTAVSRDGPFNLYNAVRVAGSLKAVDQGVLIVMNDEILSARETTKGNTYRMDTFVARDVGPLGYADSDQIVFYRRLTYRHTAKTEFDLDKLTTLPRVDVEYTHQDSDRVAVDAFIAAGAKGVILTSRLDDAVKDGQAKGVVFVSGDRKGSGRVVESVKQAEKGLITSDNLPPHKARILLRLALTVTTDPKEIQRMFNEY